jgi:hypothetical protein
MCRLFRRSSASSASYFSNPETLSLSLQRIGPSS